MYDNKHIEPITANVYKGLRPLTVGIDELTESLNGCGSEHMRPYNIYNDKDVESETDESCKKNLKKQLMSFKGFKAFMQMIKRRKKK